MMSIMIYVCVCVLYQADTSVHDVYHDLRVCVCCIRLTPVYMMSIMIYVCVCVCCIRLTPVYMMSIMIYVCLMRYWGEGPFWPSTLPDRDNCEKYWWTNLLYINDLVYMDDQVRARLCVSACHFASLCLSLSLSVSVSLSCLSCHFSLCFLSVFVFALL